MIRLKIGVEKKETTFIKWSFVPRKGEFVIYENKKYQVAEVVHYIGETGVVKNGTWVWIMPVDNDAVMSW